MFLSLLVMIQQWFQQNPENIMAFYTRMAVAGEYEKSTNDLTHGQLRIRLVFRQHSLPRKTRYIPLKKAVIATEACNSLNNLTWSDLSDCKVCEAVLSQTTSKVTVYGCTQQQDITVFHAMFKYILH